MGTIANKIEDLKIGQVIDLQYTLTMNDGSSTTRVIENVRITSITPTRVNLQQGRVVSVGTTGRSSDKFFVSRKNIFKQYTVLIK